MISLLEIVKKIPLKNKTEKINVELMLDRLDLDQAIEFIFKLYCEHPEEAPAGWSVRLENDTFRSHWDGNQEEHELINWLYKKIEKQMKLTDRFKTIRVYENKDFLVHINLVLNKYTHHYDLDNIIIRKKKNNSLTEIIKKIPLTNEKEKFNYKLISGAEISLEEILDYVYPILYDSIKDYDVDHYYEDEYLKKDLRKEGVDLRAIHFMSHVPFPNSLQRKHIKTIFKDLLNKEQCEKKIIGNYKSLFSLRLLKIYKIKDYIIYHISGLHDGGISAFFIKKLNNLSEQVIKKIPLSSKEKLHYDIITGKLNLNALIEKAYKMKIGDITSTVTARLYRRGFYPVDNLLFEPIVKKIEQEYKDNPQNVKIQCKEETIHCTYETQYFVVTITAERKWWHSCENIFNAKILDIKPKIKRKQNDYV